MLKNFKDQLFAFFSTLVYNLCIIDQCKKSFMDKLTEVDDEITVGSVFKDLLDTNVQGYFNSLDLETIIGNRVKYGKADYIVSHFTKSNGK